MATLAGQTARPSDGAAPQTAGREAYAPDDITPPSLGIAGWAKVLCSAVFVSGRDPNEAFRNSGFFLTAEKDRPFVTYRIDRERREVYTTYKATITRKAKFYGDQGCVIHPPGEDRVYFTPVSVKTSLPDPNTQPWPMGDVLSSDPLPAEIDKRKLDAAVNAAFADPDALTAAFVAVHRGRLIAERYMPGITKDTQLESWSMGKSLAATIFSQLVRDGTYRIEDPAPIDEWRKQPDDPRAKIRIIDLLHMSSGLRFIAGQDPDYTPDKGYPDHMLIYTGAIDAVKHSYTRAVQFSPDMEGRYRNSDPLLVMHLVRKAIEKRGEQYLTYPQRALLDKIGIRRQMLEVDPYGNFLITGYDYGTARNWARIGLLHLQDGIWMGQRILPEGWAKFVSSPAPAWKEPRYGALWWVNGTGALPVPTDAYYASGAGGQTTLVIPSRQLVVVRMGHFRGAGPGGRAFHTALALLMEAIPPEAKTN